MPAFGSSPACLCGKCNTRSECDECCYCVPTAACLYLCAVSGGDCIGPAGQASTTWNCSSKGWGVSNILPGIDVFFSIEKSQGDECRLYLNSSALGITGDDRPSVSVESDFCCQKCLDFTKDIEFTSSRAIDGCSSWVATIYSYPVVENPIAKCCPGCSGCGCIPKNITVFYSDSNCESETTVTYDPTIPGWSATLFPANGTFPTICDPPDSFSPCLNPSVTFTFTLGKNENDECTLTLSGSFSGESRVMSSGSCPYNFSPGFEWFGSSGQVVNIRGGDCRDRRFFECCGCRSSLPDVLTCTVTSDCDCAPEITFDLNYNPESGGWEGSAPFGDCGNTILIELRCNGSALDFSLYNEITGGCYGCGQDLSTVVCDPFEVTGTHTIGVSAVCGCSSETPTITITITE